MRRTKQVVIPRSVPLLTFTMNAAASTVAHCRGEEWCAGFFACTAMWAAVLGVGLAWMFRNAEAAS